MSIVLIGGFSELVELCFDCGCAIEGYTDNNGIQENLIRYNIRYLGTDSSFNYEVNSHKAKFLISPDSPGIRKSIETKLNKFKLEYATLVSPNSKISHTAEIGKGVVVQYGAHISSYCVISDFVRINVFANVMHDTFIGKYTTIAPNASVMGRVRIGSECYIGANSTILPEISICDSVIVGAGAVVVKDILTPGTYVGVPARLIEH